MKEHPPSTVAVVLVVLGLVGACTPTGAPGEPAMSAPQTSALFPSTSGASAATTVPTSPVTVPETTIAREPLPSNSEDYAISAFEAWREGNDDLLGRLMTDGARQGLKDASLEPAADWEVDGCQAEAGSTLCTWEGPDGTLTFRVDNQAASRAEEGAVVETLVAGG